MIHHVDGTLVESDPGRIVVEVGGIGLELLVSDATSAWLPAPGGRSRLLTHVVVREDAWTLFGFAHDEERALFRLLLGVQGVGPRVALSILSGLRSDRLRQAVAAGDVAALTVISGVGKKTAQRMIVDLRDKLGGPDGDAIVPVAARVTTAKDEPDDAVDALVALGYSRPIARDAVQSARPAGDELAVEELVKLALRRL